MMAVRWRHSGNAMNFSSSPKPTLRLSRRAWAGVLARPHGSARTLVSRARWGTVPHLRRWRPFRGAQAFELLLGFAQGRLEGANAEAREMAFIWFTKRLLGNKIVPLWLKVKEARQFRRLIERLRPGITLRE